MGLFDLKIDFYFQHTHALTLSLLTLPLSSDSPTSRTNSAKCVVTSPKIASPNV